MGTGHDFTKRTRTGRVVHSDAKFCTLCGCNRSIADTRLCRGEELPAPAPTAPSNAQIADALRVSMRVVGFEAMAVAELWQSQCRTTVVSLAGRDQAWFLRAGMPRWLAERAAKAANPQPASTGSVLAEIVDIRSFLRVTSGHGPVAVANDRKRRTRGKRATF